jgi:hypothetical protein
MRRLTVLALLAALALPGAAGASLLPQDDAGSGKDAPDTRTATFRIKPGAVYTGMIEGKVGDLEDWYAFTAPAGARIEARAASPVGCVALHDPAGKELEGLCSIGFAELGEAAAVAKTAGTYYLRYYHRQPDLDDTVPHAYRFSLGVGAPAPAPTPADARLANLFPAEPGLAPLKPATRDGDHVVVAVVDTGINPYHHFFRAPALDRHPRSWLRGFPASAKSVRLSLGAKDHAAANAADADTWDSLERSTYNAADDTYDTHLYTFPGTRVVAGVSFGEFEDPLAPSPDARPVRDEYGHGTHSAGLAAGANLTAADGNVLVVAVEVGQGMFEDGIRWAARQPWIDAISVSLGARANLPVTQSPLGDRTGAEWATREAHRSGKPVFIASGNGVSGTGLAPDHCTTYTSEFTGPAWVTRIGAAEPKSGNPSWWHCVPVEATARTDVDSPSYDSVAAASTATGTSAATPNAAGHFAHLLLAGRRAGSPATRLAMLDHLLHAAAPPPAAPGAHEPSVQPVSLADQGYGLIDQAALDAATKRLLARTGPAPRPETETWFANDAAIRTALWGPGSATSGESTPQLQDDAGSGGDAPDDRSAKVRVKPGVRYDGVLDAVTEVADWYAFDGRAGDTVNVAVSGMVYCFDVVSPAGEVAGTTCGAGYAVGGTVSVKLKTTGTWYLKIHYPTPQPYSFGIGRNAPPPPVFP